VSCDDRQGYINDNASSLRSESLNRSGSPFHLLFTIAYGSRGTPMGGYFEEIYADQCAVCHGEKGEGEIAPAIGNPAMLANTTDAFLRYAIRNGRAGSFGYFASAYGRSHYRGGTMPCCNAQIHRRAGFPGCCS